VRIENYAANFNFERGKTAAINPISNHKRTIFELSIARRRTGSDLQA
jgi:hypothetical protein